MTATSEQYAGQLLAHVLNNADLPGIGDAQGLRGSADSGSLWLALWGPGGEVDYPGYARVELPRDGSQWTITGRRAYLTEAKEFGENTGSDFLITGVKVATRKSGGQLIYTGEISLFVIIRSGEAPRLSTSNYIEA